MNAKIPITLIIFCCLGSFAQAGVISCADWDSGMTVSSETSPEVLPERLEEGSETNSVANTTNPSISLSTLMALCLTMGVVSNSPSLVSYINQSDWSLPPCPVLDGLIKPA